MSSRKHIITLKPYHQVKYELFDQRRGFGKNIRIIPEILEWLEDQGIDYEVFWGGFWDTQLCFKRPEEVVVFRLFWA